MPTGGGKTAIFSWIAMMAAQRGGRILILVHRQELLRQCSASLDRLGVRHGLIAAGCGWMAESVQVASVQTLVRRMGRLDWQPTLIIIDECHHAVAGSWRKVIDACPEALLLGVTATPQRLDGRGLSDVFQHMVVGPSIADLTAMGYLSPTRVYVPPMKANLKGVRTRGGDYDIRELNNRMDTARVTGDAVEHYSRVCSGAPAIAFCVTVEHAKHVAEQFREAGYRAESLDGAMNSSHRAQLIADLGAGRLDVLTSCEIVSEGTDIPVVTAAILLRPTQSEGLYLQQVGRVLRPAPGKEFAVILDHVGNTLTHGLPSEEREWSLEGKKKRDNKAAPSVRVCPQCFAAHTPTPKCPCCGFIYQEPGGRATKFEASDGELAEVVHGFKTGDRVEVFVRDSWAAGYEFRGDAQDGKIWVAWPADNYNSRIVPDPWLEPLERVRADRSFKKQEQSNAQTLQELIAVGHRRGYKNPVGWARHIYQARQSRSAARMA